MKQIARDDPITREVKRVRWYVVAAICCWSLGGWSSMKLRRNGMSPLLFILADAAQAAAQFDPNSWMPLLSSAGTLGFSFWYSWYVTTVTLPKKDDAHAKERESMQTRFDDTVHELLIEMKSQRDQYVAWRTTSHAG